MSAEPREQVLAAGARRRSKITAALARPALLYALAVGLIALIGLALRAWTIHASLPYVDHPDEPNPINYVVRMLQTGDPNPHAFQKPSLYVYLLLAVLTVHYRMGLASGLYDSIDRMQVTTHLYTTIPGFFVWGRLLTAVLAAVTIMCAYRLGSRLWSRPAGLLAALFLAVSPFHMRSSQYVTTDVASGLLVLLAFGAAIAVARAGRWRDYLAAGAFAGLAASTKYNAGVAATMVVAAHLIYWWSVELPAPASAAGRRLWHPLRQLPRLVAAGAAALLGFVAGTPYAALSFAEFRGGLLGQVKDYGETAHGDFTGAWNVGGYLEFFWGEGLGLVAGLAVLAGLVLLLRRRERGRPAALLWTSFVLPYLLLHLAQTSHFTRNMLPVVVLSAIPFGVAGAALMASLARRWQAAPAAYLVPLGVAVVLLAQSVLGTWSYVERQRHGDTRLQALAWIDAHVAPGERIAAEMRPLPGSFESRWAEAPALPQRDLAWYRRQGYAYLLASSDVWRQWPIPAEYGSLAGRAPAAEFGGPEPRFMFGPHLAIYPTGLAAADVPAPIAGEARVGGARLLGVAIGQPDAVLPTLGLEPAPAVKVGAPLALRTFWSVEQPFDRDYFIYVHLLDAAGNRVAQRDAPPWQGRFPTSVWRPGSLVVDINDLALPPNLAPGTYSLLAGMFDPASGGRPPTTLDGAGVDAIEIGQIVVE